MSRHIESPFGFGGVRESDIRHKFGRNSLVTTSFAPVTIGGIWRMPQVSGATALRVKAGNAADTVDGAGAREVQLEGLDATGAYVVETLATAGASASLSTTTLYIRMPRARVTKSGAYPDDTTGSHVGDIVIENSAGTQDWLTIATDSGDLAHGQSEIGADTVPLGKKAIISGFIVHTDANKPVDLAFKVRKNILETSAPYSPMLVKENYVGVVGTVPLTLSQPAIYPALTDMLMVAKVAQGDAEVSVDWLGILVDE